MRAQHFKLNNKNTTLSPRFNEQRAGNDWEGGYMWGTAEQGVPRTTVVDGFPCQLGLEWVAGDQQL